LSLRSERFYPDKYTQALEETDYEYGTLANCKWVASKVEFSLRSENLSYKHHQEVAPLEPEDQKIWLEKAEQHNLSIREDNIANEYAKGNKTFVQRVARNLGISDRTIHYALQAHDKYPDIQLIPEGKNISCKNMLLLIPFPVFPSELELE